eukprot:jgi/Pico_ML_1/52250/g2982.t1
MKSEMEAKLRAQEASARDQSLEMEKMKNELAEKNQVTIRELGEQVDDLKKQKAEWEQRSREETAALSQKAKYRVRAAEQRVVMLSEQVEALRQELTGLHDDMHI